MKDHNGLQKHIGLSLLNFYLYSSIHIALAAAAITAFSYLSFGTPSDIYYVLFVGAATWLLYSVHRLIGINQSHAFATQGRFAIIIKYRTHIKIYAVISLVLTTTIYFQLSQLQQAMLVLPSLIALGYSLPIFGSGRRLRDFHWIKIFLIAICWSLITVVIPLYNHTDAAALVSLGLDRFLFILAITIPFDIRDRAVDRHTKVHTLATKYSEQVLKWSAILMLIISFLLAQHHLPTVATIALGITYLVSGVLIYKALEEHSDYFYTGLLDGTMLLPYLLFLVLTSITNN